LTYSVALRCFNNLKSLIIESELKLVAISFSIEISYYLLRSNLHLISQPVLDYFHYKKISFIWIPFYISPSTSSIWFCGYCQIWGCFPESRIRPKEFSNSLYVTLGIWNFREFFSFSSILGFSWSFSSLVDVDTFFSSSSQVFLLKKKIISFTLYNNFSNINLSPLTYLGKEQIMNIPT